MRLFILFLTRVLHNILKLSMRVSSSWNSLKLTLLLRIWNKPLFMLITNLSFVFIVRILFTHEICAVVKIYETIYDEMNDPQQGFNDENDYKKGVNGGWIVDHPDGSTTIITRGEPLIIQHREWLVQGVDGQWYDSNDLVEEDVESVDAVSEQEQTEATVNPEPVSEVSEITKVFHYEILEELESIIKTCNDEKEIYNECMRFVKNEVPPYIWSTTKDEIFNESSIVNTYLQELRQHITSDEEDTAYSFFQAAVCTYNTAQLSNALDKQDQLFPVFVDATKKYYNA